MAKIKVTTVCDEIDYKEFEGADIVVDGFLLTVDGEEQPHGCYGKINIEVLEGNTIEEHDDYIHVSDGTSSIIIS